MDDAQLGVPKLLKSAQVSAILLVDQSQLSRWRQNGRGPDWIDVEGTPRYDLNQVLAYLERRTRRAASRVA